MSALAPRAGELRLLAGPDAAAPYDDVGVGPALLRQAAAEGAGGWLRLYRPAATGAFGRRDTLSAGFADAARISRAAGFEPVLRSPGGRAAFYDGRALCVDLVVADPDPRAAVTARFAEFGDLLVEALATLGVPAVVAPVPGEYCPGTYSVSAGGRKLAGTAQRLTRGGWFLGAVLLVAGSDDVRDVVGPVYAALGQPCDPATVGAVDDLVPGVTVGDAAGAVQAAVERRTALCAVAVPDDLLVRARHAALPPVAPLRTPLPAPPTAPLTVRGTDPPVPR